MPDTAIFDHYEVLTRDDGSLFELGRGAMGITYKAFDTSLRIPVALKVINATYLNSEVARQRFVREARSAAQLRHRHVASVFHLGTEGDTWFYAMEFIDGETLDALIKRQGPLGPVIALTIAGQVARALNAAAQHGLVHRDIKPANLMLVKEDDELVAKVIDFGLAKAAVPGEGEDAATLSMGGFVGTPHFASPEQLEEKEIDSRSDIYSLGVTLWYMLAGQAPFAGSMAQVMSQHLTKPPPFEKLEKISPAVAEILRKMLAKDPADRYQTPAELRKAIEAALEKSGQASSPPTVTPEVVERHEDFTNLLEDTSVRMGLGSFETNTTIANRYRVASSCGETNAGRVFHAYDTQRKAEVRLIVLHPEALNDAIGLTALEREVERLVPIQHANLVGVFGFETVDRGSFLVLEWTEGFSLLDLLKARRELDADEALKLLAQAAEGADYAIGLGLNGLEFGLHQIQIHFPAPIEKENLLHTPLKSWPDFSVKLYPLGATREVAAGQTWAGAQTMVACGETSTVAGADARPQYVQALASVTYELLGGSLSPLALRGAGGPTARYTPLSTLSEEGNEVLRRALDCGRSYPSVREFSAALAQLDGLQVRHHEPKPAPPATRAPIAKSSPPATPFTPPKRKGVPIGLIGGIAAAVMAVAGAAYFFLQSQSKPKEGGEPTPQVASTDNPATSGASNPSNPTVADNSPPATPVPATPVAATPAPVTPVPSPTRQDMLAATVKAAQELEATNDWPKSLDAWLAIVKDYPESPAGKNHLESMLNHLRDRPSPITLEQFQSMREQIIESAQLGILSAMLLIGDSLRVPEPQTALHWFSVASEQGDPIALVQYGLMLRKGEGVDKPDPEKAAAAFQQAADKGDPSGKFELGECYLHGIGLVADEKRGFDLMREVADAGDSRAMTELGVCYSHGLGVQKDYTAAFQWFSKAAEKGNLDGNGNLGVLYIKGWGVKANPTKAVELFQKGATDGNAFCMQLYAGCLLEGRGVKQNKLEASQLFQKAARAGNRTAIEWCNENGVTY